MGVMEHNIRCDPVKLVGALSGKVCSLGGNGVDSARFVSNLNTNVSKDIPFTVNVLLSSLNCIANNFNSGSRSGFGRLGNRRRCSLQLFNESCAVS